MATPRPTSPSRASAISKLVLYSRRYCHLCEEMRAALESLRGEFRFEIEVLDIDADPALEEKYNDLVPVLEGDGRELCHYFLDAEKVREFLAGHP